MVCCGTEDALVQSLGTMAATALGISEKLKGVICIISFHPSLFVKTWADNLIFKFQMAKCWAYHCGVENETQSEVLAGFKAVLGTNQV